MPGRCHHRPQQSGIHQLRQMRQLRHLCRDLSHRRRSGAVGLLPGADPAQTAGRLRLTCIIPPRQISSYKFVLSQHPQHPVCCGCFLCDMLHFSSRYSKIISRPYHCCHLQRRFLTGCHKKSCIIYATYPRPVLPFLLLFCTKNPICFCADHRVPKNFSVILFAKSLQKGLTRTFKRYIIREPKFFKESPEPIPPILSGFLRYITDIWRVTDFTFHKKDFFRYNASTNQGERSF